MTRAPVLGTGVVQICYLVPDLEKTCHQFHQLFGMGPFLGGSAFVLEQHVYRGAPTGPIELRGAFGWSDNLCVEILEIISGGPSALHDMASPDGPVLHHVATFAEDYEAAREQCVAGGYPVASEFTFSALNATMCYVDTRSVCGHMLEIYPENAGIREMYRMARTLNGDWTRNQLIVPIG